MRAVLMIGLMLVLSGAVSAAAQPPLNVVVVVEQPNPFEPETYALVKLRAGDLVPVQRRALAGYAQVTLSQDRQRIFAVTPNAPSGIRIETYAADDFSLQSAVDANVPVHLASAMLAELPTRPGVLALARCWWIDTATGAVLVSPQSLGLNCHAYPRSTGLSASGRHLLLEVDHQPDGTSRNLVVEVANPGLPLLELPSRSGPILDDDSAVVVNAAGEIQLRSIVGAPTRVFPIPAGWGQINWIGVHRGVLYGTRYDGPNFRHTLIRLDTHSGEWTTLDDHTELVFDAVADFDGRWALFTKPVEEWCMVLCFFSAASQTLLDVDTGTVVETVWLQDGPASRGRGLLAPLPAVPVDTVSTPLAVLLLMTLVWIATRRRLAAVDAA